MIRRISIAVASVVFFVSIYAFCSWAQPQADPGSAQNIKVEAGKDFNVSLDSGPAIGLEWQLAGKLDESVITLVETQYIPLESGLKDDEILDPMAGLYGKQTWTFHALKAANINLSFQQVQPWDKEARHGGRKIVYEVEIVEPKIPGQ